MVYMKVLMQCGHTNNSEKILPDGSSMPSCVICDCDIIAQSVGVPNLDNRKSKCPHCQNIVASSMGLPFFKYKGPGSYEAKITCKCGYYKKAHKKEVGPTEFKIECKRFRQHGPWEYDSHYCGCRGFD